MGDSTHDPALRSWVDSANNPATDFPIQNLPIGIFKRAGSDDAPRAGVAIGDQVLDVAAAAALGALEGAPGDVLAACGRPHLNDLMAMGRGAARSLRDAASRLLRTGSEARARAGDLAARILVPMEAAELFVPAAVGDYTDFYASIQHATNIGSMFRPDNPLLPNYKWVPIGYHGRASSIVVSGTAVRRPRGQTREGSQTEPTFGPSRRLDYELEVGAFIGPGNALGAPIAIADAEQHVFGLCVLNDWSARDLQTWEYQPLGPFLAKNFATTVSPWIVTLDALAPFRAPAYPRPAGDPAPLPHLYSQNDTKSGGFDVTLEVWLSSAQMRARGMMPIRLSTGSFTEMYWTVAQLVAHHASNGCNLQPGDLLGSGTISGDTKESRGSLIERAWRGTEPIELPTGETRAFLHDGDEVVMRGYCERAGCVRIGFGECRGVVLPALGDA